MLTQPLRPLLPLVALGWPLAALPQAAPGGATGHAPPAPWYAALIIGGILAIVLVAFARSVRAHRGQ